MPTSIDRDEVRRLMDGGATVIEVLEASQYRAAHIAGAVHVPGWEMTEERMASFDRKQDLVVYCFDTQ